MYFKDMIIAFRQGQKMLAASVGNAWINGTWCSMMGV